jgi:hypothetical protein
VAGHDRLRTGDDRLQFRLEGVSASWSESAIAMGLMMSDAQLLELDGKPYVLLPRTEYDRLQLPAKANTLPALPAADRRGTVPAVDDERVGLARNVIRQWAELGLSQRGLAKLSGGRVETLCRIETG